MNRRLFLKGLIGTAAGLITGVKLVEEPADALISNPDSGWVLQGSNDGSTWVNFDGSHPPKIKDSNNVSDVWCTGEGQYTITFEEPLERVV